MMKNLIVFLLCIHLATSDLAPDDGSPDARLKPRLTFDWTSPLSMLITNTRGEQQEMELRPAPGIGGVEVECLFDGFLEKGTEGSATVLGCQNWPSVSVVVVSNFTHGTMFTFYPHNKTTVELLDSVDNEEDFVNGSKEEEGGRMKRSSYTDPEDDYVDDDSFSFAGAPPLPANLYFKLGVGYDEGFLRQMSGDKTLAEEYINNIIALSRPFYKSPSLGTNVHFVFNEEIQFLEGQEYQINPFYKGDGAKSTVNDAKEIIQTTEPLIIFAHTDDTESWRGVAKKRGACSQSGRIILKWRSEPLKAARTLVHEEGHLFGKYHDKEEDEKNAKKAEMDKTSSEVCKGKGIMTDLPINIPIRPEESTWSQCSKARFLKWFTTYGNACLKEALPCNNGVWAALCSCGDGATTNLCLNEEAGYCHLPSGTCTVKEAHVKKTLRDSKKTLRDVRKTLKDVKNSCTSFTATPGNLLKSGCPQPEELANGLMVCLKDGMTCHAVCHPGYTLDTSLRFMKCSNNQWSPLPATFTCVGPVVYFIAGGFGGLRDISVYHPTVDNVACSITPPTLNNDWQWHSTFYHDNTVHLCGGKFTASTCISHNKDTEGWKTHTLATPRKWGHTSLVLDGRVYFIGGQDSSRNYVGAESTPLPLTDTPVLTPVPNLDYKGDYPCTARIDEDTLVVTGGHDGSSSLTTVVKYNVKTHTYTQLPSLKQGRYQHGCGVLEREHTRWIIVAGGYNGRNLQTTEMLQLGGSDWTSIGNLNVARSGHSMTVTQRGVMVMGGYGSSRLSSVELLDWDSAGKTWSVVQPSLNKPRRLFGGAVEIPTSMFGCTG